MVNFTKDMKQWRIGDRIPEEKKYVLYIHNLNTLIKVPFGVVTAFPDDPIPMFNSYDSPKSPPSFSYDPTHHTSSSRSNLSQLKPVENNSVAIQTEVEHLDTQTVCQLTASLWNTEFLFAEFEQQNRNLLNEPNQLKVSLRYANRSRANAKANADRAESKVEFSEIVTSDLFEENKEVKQQLELAIYNVSPLEANKTNVSLQKNLDDYDLAMISRIFNQKDKSNQRPSRSRESC